MTVRTTALAGSNWSDGEVLTAADLNDTIIASNYSMSEKNANFTIYPQHEYIVNASGGTVTVTLSSGDFSVNERFKMSNINIANPEIALSGNDYFLWNTIIYQNVSQGSYGCSIDSIYLGSKNLVGPWDVSTANYDNKSEDVSNEDTSPRGVFFKPDGTKMYMVGSQNDKVYQYTLNTPWDVSTANYDNKSADTSNEDTGPNGVFFKPDGTKMYMAGAQNDKVYQYTLNTPWDVSTANYDNKSEDVSNEDTTLTGVFFKSDGTKMYVVGLQNDKVYQYTLNTPWDVSTANYDNKSADISNEDTSPRGVFFKPDGTKMYMVGSQNDKVYQYWLFPSPANIFLVRNTEGSHSFT